MSFYSETVYRPPSEGNSLILRVTRGCSHNQCTFCTMYKDRPFERRPLNEILAEIDDYYRLGYRPRRIFLADGNALSLETPTLLSLLQHLYRTFPQIERISSYAAPKDVLAKTPQDLSDLYDSGLKLVYFGLESGSDQILAQIHKGATAKDMIIAGQRLRSSGMQLSVTVISGLGGREHWENHAIETAKVLNLMKPHYLGLLTLMIDPSAPLYKEWRQGNFTLLEGMDILRETHLLLSHLELEECTFRSNHASNYFALKGNLPEDKGSLIHLLESAIAKGPQVLRTESMRGL